MEELSIYDYMSNLRCSISSEGEIKTPKGTTVGFINNSGQAANFYGELMGDVNAGGQVFDLENEYLGTVDYGTGSFRDGNGSHFYSINRSGDVYDKMDSYVGRIEPFSYHLLNAVTAFIVFFDQGWIQEGKRSLISNVDPLEKEIELREMVKRDHDSIYILDPLKEIRAEITSQGDVKNAKGEVVGFINNDNQAGDQEENFLGAINAGGQITDQSDSIIGNVELDHGQLRDEFGSFFVGFSSDGTFSDKMDSICGFVEPFTYRELNILALYIFFFDKQIIDPNASSSVV
eukprot:TRINITY_DN12405_c0_g1_i1.p1 TRINITY_DN12405_c0_g1~~TRINITY_DN12405_c0_g1_i1.p1  ORF type:complete len:289 (-),score=65.61 TRINITY_DN12405_c0_g1_i1:359-1225(-)